jgi:hypothetical protein
MLLLEDKRPLVAKLHTAHVMRMQRFMSAHPRRALPKPNIDMRPLWTAPHIVQIRDWLIVNTGSVRHIQKHVCEFYSLPLNDMLSQRKDQRTVRARHIAIYLARTLTRLSLPQIAKRFGGRDHSTVIHAIDSITRKRAVDCELDDEIIFLEDEVRGSYGNSLE